MPHHCCAMITGILSPLVASASCLRHETCQLVPKHHLRQRRTHPHDLKACSTLVTAAEITVEKTSTALRKYHNKCERHFLSLQFTIRNEERCKRPNGFLGSCRDLPQTTIASQAAAHAPLNYSLISCTTALLGSKRWIQLTYIYKFKFCRKSQIHCT